MPEAHLRASRGPCWLVKTHVAVPWRCQGRRAPIGAKGARVLAQLQDILERGAQAQVRFGEPDRMDMRAEEVLVSQVESRRCDGTRHHGFRPLEEVLIVRAPRGAIREDQRRLAAAPRAPAALCIIRRRRRHVAQVDRVQFADVDAKFHCGRAIQNRELRLGKTLFPIDSQLGRNLGGVLTCLQTLRSAPLVCRNRRRTGWCDHRWRGRVRRWDRGMTACHRRPATAMPRPGVGSPAHRLASAGRATTSTRPAIRSVSSRSRMTKCRWSRLSCTNMLGNVVRRPRYWPKPPCGER